MRAAPSARWKTPLPLLLSVQLQGEHGGDANNGDRAVDHEDFHSRECVERGGEEIEDGSARYEDAHIEEGEFRKRVQFMYGGKLQKIMFWYKGPSVEAVLDRLPTAKILQHNGNGYLISAEVFGKGINMWLRSQGDMVKVVEIFV